MLSFTDFNDKLRESGTDLMDEDKTKEIMEMISECKGVNLANFLPVDAFGNLVRKQLDRISGPCEQLVEKVHSYAEAVHLQVREPNPLNLQLPKLHLIVVDEILSIRTSWLLYDCLAHCQLMFNRFFSSRNR